MDEIRKIIEDLGIDAFENNIKIAGLAVLSDSGNLIFQTDNWDLTNQTSVIMNAIKGDSSLILNNAKFSVVETNIEGIIATNDSGMGHLIIVFFQGGALISYAMPQADPPKIFAFLKNYTMQLNGKLSI